MSNSDFSRALSCAVALAASAFAADVTLIGDDQITGELVSMDAAGTLTLSSPLSAKPIKVKGDSVQSVEFDVPENAPPVPDQRLELINGDILPVRVESLDATSMSVSSDTLGKVTVSRKVIDSLQLGIVPESVVYRSVDETRGWKKSGGGEKNWEVAEGEFRASGQGTLARDLKLPEKFILRYTLEWSKQPNFRMFFGGKLDSPGQPEDRYFLQFAGSGLEIRRESSGNPRFTPIVFISRTPDRFPSNRVSVELRVDRTRGTIQVYLNGELEGRYTDPVPDIPRGGHIILDSRIPRESGQTVSGLEVLVWDDRGDRHRTEDRGDPGMDSLIGRFGERFGGTLVAIRPDPDGNIFEFKSDFKKDPILLPEQEVSTIFLAGEEAALGADDFEGLVLRLRGGGEMRVSSCEFGEETVQAVHPLLGQVLVARSGISSLERRSIPKANPVKSE